jgi:hypothetical protein
VSEVTHSSVVELITTGRSGEIGIQVEDAIVGGAA